MGVTKLQVASSGWVSGTIKDKEKPAVAFQPITLVYTIYDKATSTIINSRNATALTPATDAPSGVIGFRLAVGDQALAVATNETETHVLRLLWTWNAGASSAEDEIEYKVTKDPTPTS